MSVSTAVCATEPVVLVEEPSVKEPSAEKPNNDLRSKLKTTQLHPKPQIVT
ncbi:hypothetical protein JCM19239_5197 [Vibrio variabilis]|uniref:Uncharacterized protein n=1 Tax=Vibrio variabilis TaxID=990271 RepID=A0ABQ0JD77_9VIBR|nr:hypothetical protein JCM19239_5197 [Vibrio variabilis]